MELDKRPSKTFLHSAVLKIPSIFRYLVLSAALTSSGPCAAVEWQPWSDATFARAKSENLVVFLYLEAVWCHWCHVMQRETLGDTQVQRTLASHFLAIKVDQDSNPLLANHYSEYGWPALIFFAPDGSEIVKRSGYIEPQAFNRLLNAIVSDSSPESDDGGSAPQITTTLTASSRAHLLALHDSSYDADLGGLRLDQKFVDADSIEYAIVHRSAASERHKAEQTLDAAQALLDPVWGGAYQYSTYGDWRHPHFEKIMHIQARCLRIYAQAYAAMQRPEDRRAAESIRNYLLTFLRSPEGAFYVSQDADVKPGEKANAYFAMDDQQRRGIGIPRIDRHIYAQENGEAAEALAIWYAASGDAQAVAAASAAAQWTLSHRRAEKGGLHHGTRDIGGPFLGDSLSMGRACLALYAATAQRHWLADALRLAAFIDSHFRNEKGGYLTAASNPGPVQPSPDFDENISAARFFNVLYRYSGDERMKEQSDHAFAWLAARAGNVGFEAIGVVLAADEMSQAPLHLTVVGRKDDPTATALFSRALRTAGSYTRVEWLDRRDGELRNNDVEYPAMNQAAGYVCTDRRCSAPSFTPESYALALQRIVTVREPRPNK